MKIIEVKDLNKSFKVLDKNIDILKSISFDVEKGEFISILGPSGSGKSTLLNIIGSFEDYDSGIVSIDGKKINELKIKEKLKLRKESIGFVFQFYNLISHLNVIENLVLPTSISGKLDYKKADSLLKRVNLEKYRNYYPDQLSGGMQQRVAIARCLMNDPSIILADEPIGNLDYNSGNEIMQLFSMLNKEGLTIIMVTHNEELTKYGSRVIKIIDGKISYDKKNIE